MLSACMCNDVCALQLARRVSCWRPQGAEGAVAGTCDEASDASEERGVVADDGCGATVRCFAQPRKGVVQVGVDTATLTAIG